MRVYEIARRCNVTSSEILEALQSLHIFVSATHTRVNTADPTRLDAYLADQGHDVLPLPDTVLQSAGPATPESRPARPERRNPRAERATVGAFEVTEDMIRRNLGHDSESPAVKPSRGHSVRRGVCRSCRTWEDPAASPTVSASHWFTQEEGRDWIRESVLHPRDAEVYIQLGFTPETKGQWGCRSAETIRLAVTAAL